MRSAIVWVTVKSQASVGWLAGHGNLLSPGELLWKTALPTIISPRGGVDEDISAYNTTTQPAAAR